MNWCYTPQSQLARKLSIDRADQARRARVEVRITWTLIGFALGVSASCFVTWLARVTA